MNGVKITTQSLKTRLGDKSPKFSTSPRVRESNFKPIKKSVETPPDVEVEALKQQIQQLQQIGVMKVGYGLPVDHAQPHPKPVSAQSRARSSNEREDYFCYRCGEDGHVATKCKSPENLPLVIQKLVHSLRKAKSGRSDAARDSPKSGTHDCYSARSQDHVSGTRCLPKGLVGPSSTVSVKINGHPCKALLDSGFQVTIVFDSWYSKYLPEVPLQPLDGLSIWGLSSSSYPYKGYIVIDA